MLENILHNKSCFKLVCGAGNEDAIEVEKLVALYSLAGANYFDLSARVDVVEAAWRGLRRVIPENQISNYFLNVSVGIKGDPHVSKALINPETCIACGICHKTCVNKAVFVQEDGLYTINNTRCIGCGACIRECPVTAVSAHSENTPLDEVLPPLVALGIHSIELHAVSLDEEGIMNQWKAINKYFDGILSVCVDRSVLGDVQLINRIQRLIEGRKEFTTIVQADGAPMSGCDDRAETTLQAIATAHIVQKAKLPVFLMLSGGTNSKTAELAKQFNIQANGVALGSYARIIVREYIDRDDFFDNREVFEKALAIAKDLVYKNMKYMG